MSNAELVERVARAMRRADGGPSDLTDDDCADYIPHAHAALAVVAAAVRDEIEAVSGDLYAENLLPILEAKKVFANARPIASEEAATAKPDPGQVGQAGDSLAAGVLIEKLHARSFLIYDEEERPIEVIRMVEAELSVWEAFE